VLQRFVCNKSNTVAKRGFCWRCIGKALILWPRKESPMIIRSFLAVALLFSQIAGAQTPEAGMAAAAPSSSPTLSLEEARAQRAYANTLKAEAEQRHATDQAACYKKFLVNDCLDEAKKTYTGLMVKARELDQAGRHVEREAQRRDVEKKEAARAIDLPQREADQQAQAERYRAEEAGKAAERERKLADKAKQAGEGRRKTAAEQAARRQKLEQRAKEDAEREAKKSAAPNAATPTAK
jgi:hypothetical protein